MNYVLAIGFWWEKCIELWWEMQAMNLFYFCAHGIQG